MINGRTRRLALFGLILALLLIVLGAEWIGQNGRRVQIVDAPDPAWTPCGRPLGEALLCAGRPAAIDEGTATVYVSWNPADDPEELARLFSMERSGYRLFLIRDAYFDCPAEAMAENHAFRLLVLDKKSGEYAEYRLVLTSLPVLTLTRRTEKPRDGQTTLYKGDFCLFMPEGADDGTKRCLDSRAQWHVRGGTTTFLEKKSFKLDLKTDDGDWNRPMDLAGLGADDDWILDSMSMDDLKVREQLFMTLWNSVEKENRMSEGVYVEVVLNGAYQGLYLLQRRIDAEYLGLDDSQILLKIKRSFEEQGAKNVFEIVSSPFPDEETYALIDEIQNAGWETSLDPDEFIDVNLFLSLFSAFDNAHEKNMFFLLEKREEGWRTSLIPWDTDMTLGLLWHPEAENAVFGLACDYEAAMQDPYFRRETKAMQEAYPELERETAERWFERRETFFSRENLFGLLNDQLEALEMSGAYERELAVRPPVYKGDDTLEGMCTFLEERLSYLDAYYGRLIQKP